MSVHQRLVKMEEHVPMPSTPTPVDVWQDTLGRTVNQVRYIFFHSEVCAMVRLMERRCCLWIDQSLS